MEEENPKKFRIWIWLIPVYIALLIPLVKWTLKIYSPDVELSGEELSAFSGEGKIQKDAECLLLLKTRTELYAQVEAAILENHSYEVPEIVQLPIGRGFDRYLRWIDENTLDEAATAS